MTSMLRTTLATFIAVAVLTACSSPKPPPGWPEGAERPINANVPATPAVKTRSNS